jgi:hypothetical protein
MLCDRGVALLFFAFDLFFFLFCLINMCPARLLIVTKSQIALVIQEEMESRMHATPAQKNQTG